MNKRAPEMVRLHSSLVAPWGFVGEDEYCGDDPFEMVDAGEAKSAIRSLRVKLFRERAHWHKTEGEANEQACCYSAMGQHFRAADRFSRIADAIARGEK